MNAQRNTRETYALTQTQILEQFFFFPKTIKGQYLLDNFTQEMVPELRRFMCYFTEEDVERILSSGHPKECLYTVAEIIGRIRKEYPVSQRESSIMKKTIKQTTEKF